MVYNNKHFNIVENSPVTRINQKGDVVLLLLIKEGIISIAVKDTDDYNKLKKQIGLLDF